MKTYTFLIGSMDDFESIEELIDYVEANGDKGFRSYSTYEFDAPVDCSEDLITMIGRGHAFSSGWSMDDTVSFMVSGSLDETGSQTQMQLYDLWETE